MKRFLAVVLGLLTLFSLAGCSDKSPLDPNDPVTLTMWHNYGGEMQNTMDVLIERFNATVGREQGIIVKVEAVSSSADLNKSLVMIANDDPGAPKCPDIFTGYPKIAVQLWENGKLANLADYFSEEELSAYVDAFVEEGRLLDGGLYVFPIAKSTEILYLNQTLFDEFAVATGADAALLSTFEGLAELSRQYYEWTDGQTPDVSGDGKAFFAADSWFNIAEVGMVQLGGSLFYEDGSLALDSDTYAYIFETLYAPSVTGGFALFDGYSSDLSKTGDIVCSTGSSAGILFYGDTITYPDATVKQVEYSILPYPVFEDGEKLALQRGGGLMVAKTDEKKEYAAAEFIKWLTAAEQNMAFVSETGYLPVTKQAFEQDMQTQLEAVEDARIKKMLTAVVDMYGSYQFFTAPNFSDFDAVSSKYKKDWYYLLTKNRREYAGGNSISAADALAEFKN